MKVRQKRYQPSISDDPITMTVAEILLLFIIIALAILGLRASSTQNTTSEAN